MDVVIGPGYLTTTTHKGDEEHLCGKRFPHPEMDVGQLESSMKFLPFEIYAFISLFLYGSQLDDDDDVNHDDNDGLWSNILSVLRSGGLIKCALPKSNPSPLLKQTKPKYKKSGYRYDCHDCFYCGRPCDCRRPGGWRSISSAGVRKRNGRDSCINGGSRAKWWWWKWISSDSSR